MDELQRRQSGLFDSGLRGTALLAASVAIVGVLVAAVFILVIDLTSKTPSRSEVLAAALTPSPRDNVIVCEAGPIDLDEGTSAIINFSAPELAGYNLTEVQLNPQSVDTPSESLRASIDGTLSTLLEANETEALEDEPAMFQLRATFHSGDGEYVSICNVRVLPVALEVEPTVPGRVEAQPEEPPTPRPRPEPRVIEARLVAPPTPVPEPSATSIPPSSFTIPWTATPSVTRAPGELPPTQTPTPISTRRPTATPTKTPIPTPTFTPVPPTPTFTPVPTATPTPVTPTSTPTPVTPTATPVTPTSTPTPVTPTATSTPVTPTVEPTADPTAEPTVEPTADPSPTGILGELLGWLGL